MHGVEEGKIKFNFILNSDYLFLSYTFNVVNNYNNSVNNALPNLMMTKRYTLEEFTPIIAEIDILHNDGTVFNQA